MAPDESARSNFGWRWRGAVALAALVGLLSFLVLRHPIASENHAADRQMLQQTEKLFPNQLNALVEENGKVDLSISQSPEIGSDQPLLVIFKQGNKTIRVLSYSGHRVCLRLGNAQNCFEILATPTGGVILEGENKVWLASPHSEVAGYAVRAQTLEASL